MWITNSTGNEWSVYEICKYGRAEDYLLGTDICSSAKCITNSLNNFKIIILFRIAWTRFRNVRRCRGNDVFLNHVGIICVKTVDFHLNFVIFVSIESLFPLPINADSDTQNLKITVWVGMSWKFLQDPNIWIPYLLE